MIRYFEDEKECYVDISGKRAEIRQVSRAGIIAECQLNDLRDETGVSFSENLKLHIENEDGFGTNLFYTMLLFNLGTEICLVFLSNLDDDHVDDATDYAQMVESIPGKKFKDDGFRSSGLSISYTSNELAVVKEISLTKNIYDSIRETAQKINKLFGLKIK